MTELIVEIPKNPDESLALDVIQAVWPILGYLRDAPARLRVEVKIALSNTVWDALRILRFEPGMSPVDPIGGKLFGYEVVVNHWPRERVELVIPVGIAA